MRMGLAEVTSRSLSTRQRQQVYKQHDQNDDPYEKKVISSTSATPLHRKRPIRIQATFLLILILLSMIMLTKVDTLAQLMTKSADSAKHGLLGAGEGSKSNFSVSSWLAPTLWTHSLVGLPVTESGNVTNTSIDAWNDVVRDRNDGALVKLSTNSNLSSAAATTLSHNEEATNITETTGIAPKRPPFVLECTLQQQRKIYYDIGRKRRRMKNTNCPEPTWIESYYSTLAAAVVSDTEDKSKQQPPFLAINVGCNKGHDAIRLARMGMRNPVFDESIWRTTFFGGMQKKDFLGFACKKDHQRNDMELPSLGVRRRGEVHCIEPLPQTYDRVANSSFQLGLNNEGFVVTHAAISNATGSILFPTGKPGLETASIGTCTSADGQNCVNVSMYGLDDYVSKFVPHAGPIHVLMIDAEGFDFDVLVGATETLKRVQYLEFEYHSVGSWEMHSVLDAVDGLLADFTCYWAGRAKLWRISRCASGKHLNWLYGSKSWSNVACVHRNEVELTNLMEEMFLRTITSSTLGANEENTSINSTEN